ncbi:MAG: hypothetical protein ACRC91_11590 [Aeromonas sp.]
MNCTHWRAATSAARQRLRWGGDQVLSVAGRYQLVVDETGNSDRIEFRMVHPDGEVGTAIR